MLSGKTQPASRVTRSVFKGDVDLSNVNYSNGNHVHRKCAGITDKVKPLHYTRLSDFVRVIPGDRLRDVTDSDWDG